MELLIAFSIISILSLICVASYHSGKRSARRNKSHLERTQLMQEIRDDLDRINKALDDPEVLARVRGTS